MLKEQKGVCGSTTITALELYRFLAFHTSLYPYKTPWVNCDKLLIMFSGKEISRNWASKNIVTAKVTKSLGDENKTEEQM